MKITLDKTQTLESIEHDKYIDMNFERTGRKLPYPSFRNAFDQYDLYRKELLGCDSFRLITTIRPYCTNVLFNPLTEVIENGRKVHNWNENDFTKNYVWSTQNTTDSKYKYCFGSDIFSNHLLRNISFKAVNNGGDQGSFNTMKDSHRNRLGKIIDSALYGYGDCMPFIVGSDSDELYNCMDYELKCVDGWYGFSNKTNIQTKSNRNYKEMARNCSSVVGNEPGGKFIQLYPTKDEFMFNPVYNKAKQRVEYNWDICLTYPYKNYVNHEFVQEDEWNGLLVKSVKSDKIYTPNGGRGFLVSMYVPHNMQIGEHFTLSYKIGDKVVEPYRDMGIYLSVMKLGDLLGKNKEYTFLVSEEQMKYSLGDILYKDGEYIGDEKVKETLRFRFRKLRKNVESIYYYRVFRKLPNFKYAPHYLELPIVKDETQLDEYLKSIEETHDGFNNEMYPLGFSQTVYNDLNTQITFTDTIAPDMLVDNLGRPLTEIYMTVVKSNRGYKEWYEDNDSDIKDDNIEVSHCFGEISMGVKCEEKYSNRLSTDALEKKYDVRVIDNTKEAGERVSGISFECNEERYGTVNINDRYFLGDIVEFNAEMVKEYQLSLVYHRFNTWQRENVDFLLPYENINGDDSYKMQNIKVDKHLEGYYYQPHYRVQLKEFGEIKEGEHNMLSISRVNRYDKKGDNDKTAVADDNHNCYLFRLYNRQRIEKGDYIRIRMDEMFYKMPVIYVPNSLSFVIDVTMTRVSPVKNGVVWEEISSELVEKLKGFLQNRDMNWAEVDFIWKENIQVPWYAVSHPMKENRYLWREIYNYGDIRCQELDNSVMFANGHIYLNLEIDFFLRRQDPYGFYGKLYKGDLPDLLGDKMKDPPNKETPFNEIVC